ncbi:hypothetical protein Mgra_00008418 [Meloidogyne graminicola]|uniref:Dienelactone hydrolase domain-containing protein n=1 Tax=Meloidogyne graminicola TaxID=189291 RepID=A0A8S9ZFS6_9BILA|nr:hypothetical protein Mgra_00008418 [Meloidogyne graminicola]
MEPKIIESKHEYIDKIDNTVLEGFFCLPEPFSNFTKPAVLICHAFGGLGNFEEEKCRELARLGFVSFAIDLYGKGKRGQTIEENMSLLKPFLEDRTSLLRRRLLYGLETLKLESSVDKEKFMGIMAEMRARKSDWQFIIYGNAKHGFTDKRLEGSTREGVGYNKEADNRSWSAMLALFKEKFGIP